MAQAMVSQFGRPDLLALARDAAEAEVDVLRIRRVRAALIPRALEIEHMPNWLPGGPSLGSDPRGVVVQIPSPIQARAKIRTAIN
jgi:hypothetical protein